MLTWPPPSLTVPVTGGWTRMVPRGQNWWTITGRNGLWRRLRILLRRAMLCSATPSSSERMWVVCVLTVWNLYGYVYLCPRVYVYVEYVLCMYCVYSCVCVYICVCVYMDMYVYMIHVCICDTSIYICRSRCIYVFIYVFMCMHLYTLICIYMYIFIYIYI